MVLFAHSNDDAYYADIKQLLDSAKSQQQLYKSIVNTPFNDKTRAALLGLGIVVLLLVNPETGNIDRVALSDTELAEGAVRMSVKPFKDIKIPLAFRGNFIAEAIRSGRYQQTSDWRYLFAPALSPEEAHLNQAGAGIGCSYVYPIKGINNGGALIFSYFQPLDKIGSEHRQFMHAYSRIVASAINNFSKLPSS